MIPLTEMMITLVEDATRDCGELVQRQSKEIRIVSCMGRIKLKNQGKSPGFSNYKIYSTILNRSTTVPLLKKCSAMAGMTVARNT